ncbi:GNAT family N-acetyltransferase [Myroides sp. TSA_177.3]|uniref:GNAT family N-acetyltransferase n=1 Tax=Myroides sp. TSA_177.3 TaxID=3415650 RepID=UPI00404655EE
MSMILETSRLLVQPIHLPDDCTALLVIHNHLNTMRWIPNNKTLWTQEDLTKKYQINQQLYPQQLGLYKIVLKNQEPSLLIGEIGLFPCSDSLTHVEIGYILHENFWKQGLATELLEAIAIFIQRHLHYTVIRAQLFDSNIASKKLLERCSYQYEGSVSLQEPFKKLIYHNYIIR